MKTKLVNEAAMAAERRLVGWALTQHELGSDRRAGDLGIEEDKFHEPRMRSAWGTILRMEDSRERIDPVTLAAAAQATGFPVDLATICQAMLEPSMLPEEHAAIVREAWVSRQVLLACSRVIAENEHDGLAGAELLTFALGELAAVTVEQPEEARTIGELVKERYRQLAELAGAKAKGQIAVTGVPTGIRALDGLLGGLQRGICTVVASRPGQGKTATAQSITANVSAMGGLGVHVFSLEDTRDAYTDRALARESLVPAEQIRGCDLERADLSALSLAADSLGARRGWLVDDRSGITAEEVVRSVRRSLRSNRTQVVVVDYLQLLRGPPRSDRTEAASNAMNVLADAAKQDGLAYLVLAQLNRECERRDDKRPLLSDLKQSGAIEERAKAVLMLYRPSTYDERDPSGQPYPESRLEILVRKNNHGQTGRVLATWYGPTTRVE